MSDHETHSEHDHGAGAHEIDKMPSGRLFKLLFGLSALTLAACIGVVQLFNQQVDSIRDNRNTKLSFQLAEYRQEMDELKANWTVLDITDDDGISETAGGKGLHEARLYQMPLAEARKRMLEQHQQLLKAPRPYRGWVNPDAKAPKAVAPQGPRNLGRPPGRQAPGAVPSRGMQPGAAPGAVPPGVVQPGVVMPGGQPGAAPPRVVPRPQPRPPAEVVPPADGNE